MNQKYLPFALAPLSLLMSLSAQAETVEESTNPLQEIIVTSSRTYARPSAQAQIVIDRDDIERTPATNIADLLRLLPGIQISQLFGTGSAQTTIDIGGFGATASSNTLVLVNGQRQNDIDQSAANIGNISLQNIERIEITPSSGGVLYGDGAVGGVVNIITRNEKFNMTSVRVGAGSYGLHEGSLLNQFAKGPLSGQVFLSQSNTDGYRQNEYLKRNEASGKVNYDLNNTQSIYASVSSSNEDQGQPGAVFNNMLTSPRIGNKLFDYGLIKRVQTLIGWQSKVTDSTKVIVEGSYKTKGQDGSYPSAGYYVDNHLTSAAITPRVENNHLLLGATGQLISGYDYTESRYNTNPSYSPLSSVTLASNSAYAHETLSIEDSKLTFGLRKTSAKFQTPTSSGSPYNKTLDAEFYELAFSQTLAKSTVAGVGINRSVRLPNVDDISGNYMPYAPLEPQTNINHTLFLTHQYRSANFRIDGFYNNVKHEIYYDALNFVNKNFESPTRHKGLNGTVSLGLSSKTLLTGTIGYQSAKFTNGANTGGTVPLVARHTGKLVLSHDVNSALQLSLSSAYTGSRYFDNDLANTFGQKIPSMIRTDASARYQFGNIILTGTVRNLSNEQSKYDYAGTYGSNTFYAYPLPGRNVLFSAEYRFK